jgi:hypothetical protein
MAKLSAPCHKGVSNPLSGVQNGRTLTRDKACYHG